MKKQTLTALLFFILFQTVSSQTIEELRALQTTKVKQLDSLSTALKSLTKEVEKTQKEVAALTEKITPYPRWKIGLSTTTGFNTSTYSDWLSKKQANTVAVTIGLGVNGHADLQQKRYFWNNALATNLGWLKFDDKDKEDDDDSFQVAADVFNLSSLFGWKISHTLALSLLGEYRTSLLSGTFNNPGYLDLGGGGVTWTPTPNFRAVFHSLNYNWVFSEDESKYESSPGAKVVIDYSQRVGKGFAWRSNLSAFGSYKDFDALSNWTWMNNFSTAYKGFGVGFDLGLRGNKQEAAARELEDNPVQIFWILGLTYALSKEF